MVAVLVGVVRGRGGRRGRGGGGGRSGYFENLKLSISSLLQFFYYYLWRVPSSPFLIAFGSMMEKDDKLSLFIIKFCCLVEYKFDSHQKPIFILAVID